jgi:transglutaminase-like putative cysteine protease
MTTLVAGRVRPALPPLAARVTAFAALGGFGLLHWMTMLEPAATGRALAALAVALAAGVLARRWAAALLAGVVAALVAGGVDPVLLWPTHWGELGDAIGSGIGAVAGARIPYAGTDADLRLVIGVGGALLALVAAALAFRDRRIPALVALVALYAVPAVALELKGEFLRGALLFVLVVLFLRLERLPERELAAALGLAAAAAVAALAAAPALDTKRPWFDYEEFAQQTASTRTTSFAWDHDYAALPWPRDGREMLRVESPRRAYWKVDDLDVFNGTRWLQNPVRGGPPPPEVQNFGVSEANLRRWTFPISVAVRNLRSPTLALAGVSETVTMPGRKPYLIAPGVWSAGRVVRRGDSYRSQVYVPEPTRGELEAARPAFPGTVLEDTAFHAVAADGAEFEALTRRFKQPPDLVSFGVQPAAPELRHSNLSRIYALSQRLLRDSVTPYEYVQAIQRRLGDGYSYDETPPRAARTLDGFLFDAKSGFCQQYSGAMALLLRLGGVPARVATGFAPGSYDEHAKRYVVRDLDAHSWVEAWFTGIGWVVFDPTPSSAPPRSQALADAASAGSGDIRDRGTIEFTGEGTPDEPAPWPVIALGALAVLALGSAGGLVWLRAGRRHPRVSELERALRGAGEECAPSTTLVALETRLPGARDYFRALRAERYATGAGPTAADRRALRRALSSGRSPLARARTWLALRPHLR